MLETRAARCAAFAITATTVSIPQRASAAQWDDSPCLLAPAQRGRHSGRAAAQRRRRRQQRACSSGTAACTTCTASLHTTRMAGIVGQPEHERSPRRHARLRSPCALRQCLRAACGNRAPAARRGQPVSCCGLLALMQTHGKTTATFRVHLPESHAFLAAIGATEKHRSMENRMDLRRPRRRRARPLARRSLAPAHGLRLEVHAAACPSSGSPR
jgi:hypothetical protein